MKNETHISAGTVARTLCLALALLNQLLAAFGRSPLPVDSDELTQLFSTALTMAAAVAAWWKNNSFTRAAVLADSVKDTLKATGAQDTAVCVTQTTDAVRG